MGYPFVSKTTTGIEKIDNIEFISVYPNPVTGEKLTVDNKTTETVQLVELIDSNGKTVKTIKPNQIKTEIETSSLRKGMYFLRIHTENKVLNEKIVVY